MAFSMLHGTANSTQPWSPGARRQAPLPRTRLRPALRDHREPRHRDDHRADARGRPRRRHDRGNRRCRPNHQGHLVRSGLLEPDGRYLLLGDRAPACANANGRNGFPHHVGQRVRSATSTHDFELADRRARGLAEAAGNGPGVRVDEKITFAGAGVSFLGGSLATSPGTAARGQEVHRPRKGQPAQPSASSATPTGCGLQYAATPTAGPKFAAVLEIL